MTDEEWQEWLINQDTQLKEKAVEIIDGSCRQLELNSLDIATVLIETCESAIKTSQTKKRSFENCTTWANSFIHEATLDIILKRSQENE